MRLLLGLISETSCLETIRFLEGFSVDTEDTGCCFLVDSEYSVFCFSVDSEDSVS